MRLFGLLLSINVANLVLCVKYDEVSFPVNILLSDLEAIENYHKNIAQLEAYIHWPNSIRFHVEGRNIKNENYLILFGDFETKGVLSLSSYKGVLLYKSKRFYIHNTKTGNIKLLSSTAKVHYEQWGILPKDLHLSIRYFSIDEVSKYFHTTYGPYKSYLETYGQKSPSTFLFTVKYFAEHFMEFTTVSEDGSTNPADGGLLTLIGKVENNKLSLSKTGKYERLEVNKESQNLEIRTGPNTVKDVFAVRMANTGLLTEVKEEKKIMVNPLNSEDLQDGAGNPPAAHTVRMQELLDKSMQTEPKNCDDNNAKCLSLRPKTGRFQVRGHVLLKEVNYRDDEETSVNDDCPYVIKYDRSGASFMFGTCETTELCSNNSDKLWVNKEADFYDPNGSVTLRYGERVVSSDHPIHPS